MDNSVLNEPLKLSESNIDEKSPSKKRKRRQSCLDETDIINVFTNLEIRRFLMSYKKFCNPLNRISEVMKDAALQDKNINDVMKLGCLVKYRSEKALEHFKPAGKRADLKKPMFVIAGVNSNAKDLKNDLDILDRVIPTDSREKEKWTLNLSLEKASFDVPWTDVDDLHLLIGVQSYGLGNWLSIRDDPFLDLKEKICPLGYKTPQANDLKERVSYLLYLLKLAENLKNNDQLLTKTSSSTSVMTQELPPACQQNQLPNPSEEIWIVTNEEKPSPEESSEVSIIRSVTKRTLQKIVEPSLSARSSNESSLSVERQSQSEYISSSTENEEEKPNPKKFTVSEPETQRNVLRVGDSRSSPDTYQTSFFYTVQQRRKHKQQNFKFHAFC